MIYEMRTYTLKPGSWGEVQKRWGEKLEARQKLSPLGALWTTDIGPLNQMIHVWPYESIEERNRIRALAIEQKIWPPDTREFILAQKSEILHAAPFMRPLVPAEMGGIYEMRTYTYQTGSIPEVIRRWSEAIPHREKYSPLAACWYTEVGDLNKWIHVWPYKNLAERDEIRGKAMQDPHWPAPTREFIVAQENKILVPSSISPLR